MTTEIERRVTRVEEDLEAIGGSLLKLLTFAGRADRRLDRLENRSDRLEGRMDRMEEMLGEIQDTLRTHGTALEEVRGDLGALTRLDQKLDAVLARLEAQQ